MELVVLIIFMWLGIKIIKWLWPYIKFGALFIGAAAFFGSWFVFKEISQIGAIVGAMGTITAAYQFAKNKS